MGAGKYRHRIEIQAYQSAGRDAEGYPLPSTWQTVMKAWAAKNSVSGKEFYAAAAVNSEEDVHWKIRFRKGITTDMRIFEPATDMSYELKAPPLDEKGLKKELLLITQVVNESAS